MQTWITHRGEVSSAHGLVAAQNLEAAQAGAATLATGGNAIDAAVVTALSLAILEPWLSGIGGGGVLLYAEAESGRVSALDFSVRSPKALNPADYPVVGGVGGNWFDWPAVEDDRNISGYASICIPGTISGLSEALARHGTLTFAEALAPAIAFAERGMAVDWFSSLCIAIDASGLRRFPASAALFLRNGEAPVSTGASDDRLPMPGAAALLRRLAAKGERDFYEGETADILVRELAAGGSKAKREDFATYSPHWREAQFGRYRGRHLAVVPGLTGGPSLLAALAFLEPDWQPQVQRPDAAAALAYARAIRGSYRERLNLMGHAAATGDSTTHISVVDRHGNMVSLTNTILSRFGSKVVLPQSGILMNNGMLWFDPRPDMPNAIAPGAQPLANMCPVVMMEEGQPVLAIGAAGGRSIFPAVAQLLSYVVDFGMSLEEAFLTPRLDASAPTIKVNRAAPANVAAAVATEFPVEMVSDTLYPVNFAIPSAVRRDSASGLHVGMAHQTSPWAGVATEEAALA